MKNKLIELRTNTLIIAVANIGSKAISFILAPLYSYYLTTEQYGMIDLITTTAGLLVPFICFDIFEATFRYTSDSNYDEKKVFSSSMAVCGIGAVLSIVVIVVMALWGIKTEFVIFTGIFALLDAVNSVMMQFARGRNQMRIFALSGVLNAIILLFLNIIFLVTLRLGLQGWLVSFLIGKVVVVIFLFITINFKSNFSIKSIDNTYIKKFLKFCLPLVPTATMWWVMNASDRYMISFFIGTAATGIYSVASKLPSIMSVFENVFYQAWQTTAISTLNDSDRDEFYSTILNNYIIFLCTGTLGLLVIVKPLILLLFAKDYASAWICSAPLIIGVIFHAINGNLGSLYSAFKNTKGAFYSTLLGALVNIILNILFIPWFGINGAAVTTLIAYATTFIYRWFDIKKFVHLKIHHRKLMLFYIALPLQLLLYYYSTTWSFIARIFIVILVLFKNRQLILKLVKRR